MLRLIAIAATLWSSAAAATEIVFSTDLPFEVEVTEVSQMDRAGSSYTVAEATVTNGKHHTILVEVHCEAENDDGYTWDVIGAVKDIAPNEERAIQLVSSSGDETGYFRDATKLICEVSRFDGGLR